MEVALIGYEVEGQAAYNYWHKGGADITICDMDPNKKVPVGAKTQLGDGYLKDLDRFDIIVRSAGIHPNIILNPNPGVRPKITTIIDEFLRVCPTKHVIGITGTKGKGTTSTMTTKMLQAAGKQTFLGGNIGVPPLDFLDDITPDSWVVLELSSFQLYDVQHSPAIAVCLMMTPEHLNWHSDIADYFGAKARLFDYQTPNDLAIYFALNQESKKIASHGQGRKLPYYAPPGAYVDDGNIIIEEHVICRTDDLKLLGKHNWQNACASATIVWQAIKDIEPIREVLTSFTGLEHRLEFVRELESIRYYDDSFGSTPETAMVAIEAFKAPKVIILGGSDKGVPFDELAKSITQENVRRVILIGETAPKIETALHAAGFDAITPGGKTMPEIVAAARDAAQSGDVVLLSTASASFDMFQNYKDRAAQYVTAVNAL